MKSSTPSPGELARLSINGARIALKNLLTDQPACALLGEAAQSSCEKALEELELWLANDPESIIATRWLKEHGYLAQSVAKTGQ